MGAKGKLEINSGASLKDSSLEERIEFLLAMSSVRWSYKVSSSVPHFSAASSRLQSRINLDFYNCSSTKPLKEWPSQSGFSLLNCVLQKDIMKPFYLKSQYSKNSLISNNFPVSYPLFSSEWLVYHKMYYLFFKHTSFWTSNINHFYVLYFKISWMECFLRDFHVHCL